jgi:hypothetical protein
VQPDWIGYIALHKKVKESFLHCNMVVPSGA